MCLKIEEVENKINRVRTTLITVSVLFLFLFFQFRSIIYCRDLNILYFCLKVFMLYEYDLWNEKLENNM